MLYLAHNWPMNEHPIQGPFRCLYKSSPLYLQSTLYTGSPIANTVDCRSGFAFKPSIALGLGHCHPTYLAWTPTETSCIMHHRSSGIFSHRKAPQRVYWAWKQLSWGVESYLTTTFVRLRLASLPRIQSRDKPREEGLRWKRSEAPGISNLGRLSTWKVCQRGGALSGDDADGTR